MDEAKKLFDSVYTGLQIEEAIAAGLELRNDPQLALVNLGGRPNKNWMPNAYLMGGGIPEKLPINQAGSLSGNTDWEYMFDCWKQFGGNWALTENGLSVSIRDGQLYWSVLNYSYVDVNQLIGKKFTLSFYVDGDIYSDTQVLSAGATGFNGFPGSDRCEVNIDQSQNILLVQYYGSPTGRVIHAAKLEEGNHQTLGWKDDAGTVHLFEVPPYLSTLLECQRYFLPVVGTDVNIPGVTNFTGGTHTIITPVPMAKIPVIQLVQDKKGVIYGPAGAVAVTNVSVYRANGNFVDILLKNEAGGAFCCVWREAEFYLVARP